MNAAKEVMKRKRTDGAVQGDNDGDDEDAPFLTQFCLPLDTVAAAPQRQPPKQKRQRQKAIAGPTRATPTTHTTSFPDLADASTGENEEGGTKEYLFDKSVRTAMRPSVTTQFKMTWCWPASPMDPSEVVCEADPRSVGPAFVVELRGDPHLREENRRVAAVVNCGERFLLPPLSRSREGNTRQGADVFWRAPQKPYQDAPPPYAELLFGTVQELEHASNIVQGFPSAVDLQAVAVAEGDKGVAQQDELNSFGRLRSYFFRSLPYRTLWLYQFSERLIISMPYEERLLSLNLGRSTHTIQISSRLSTKSIECVNSFRLPSCVIPLDISEVYDRPFVAVGTMCHGVLIVLLENGACASVVHRVPLLGLSTSMFPVAHVCAVFPPRRCDDDESSTLGVWGLKSALLSQSLEGCILCASPYENRTVVVKCTSAGGDGCGFESPPPTRTVAGFLCSTPYSAPAFGPVVATLDGKLMHFVVEDTGLAETDGDAATSSSKDRRQHYGAFDAVRPEVVYDNATRTLLGVTPNHFCEGGPVRQKVSHSRYQPSFARHWLCLTTVAHEVILLDRKVTNYAKHSAITLQVPTPPLSTATAAAASQSCLKKAPRGKRKEGPLPTDDGIQESSKSDTVYPAAPEDGISGISWLRVSDGMLQVVVAHHKNWITVVTWSV
ncbi:hypothetical protein TraAM80_03289 [Trypanosoma rangeli]|uniref:Uncharacterized protein n=1 Tax=Trypanosoma rangeli TaxID=5698 RepID=A0A422NQ05_TRYRA|nr:uncharacterized protein TraAM80_03289 [Trypanosoma rangeli]RNF07545.1 hypothetical protein TraAM80_03289 [Trypanosoma rangeli]|eukprot:RNF07545.1 hypothetical protein TraAM80_03289 [Trypanosoma rangeli]